MKDSTFDPSQPLGDTVVMYMAQIPSSLPKTTWVPAPGTNIYTMKNLEAEELLTAIFNLKGETAEIYTLKALAFTIKAKLHANEQGT